MRLHELLFEGVESKIKYIINSMASKIAGAAHDDHSAADIILYFQSPKFDGLSDDDFERQAASKILEKLATADPTGDRANALVWIARMYASREFLLEDVGRLRNDLTKFFQYRSKLANKDLNSYSSLDQLYDAVESVDDSDTTSKRQATKDAKVRGAKKIISTPNLTVVQLLTKEAANLYGKGTKWCTTSEHGGQFESYAQQGPLYALIVKDGGRERKFQLHLETEQFMDERDRPVSAADKKKLSKLDEYTNFLNQLIQSRYGKYFDELES